VYQTLGTALCPSVIHLLGFCGSALIILSITMRSVVRLRIIGLAGAATFLAYGLALGTWPIVVTNTVTVSIQLLRLRGLRNAGSTDAHTVHGPTPSAVERRRPPTTGYLAAARRHPASRPRITRPPA